jgi:hypothetical protein
MNPQMAIAITADAKRVKPVFDQILTDANQVGSALQASGARAATAMNATAFATGNVAAQLNDIGVMMASGQSPLILAIQQGTQLNQIFSGLSGPQVLGALKTAFLSLINPISLVTIGTIAAGAALFQYVTSLNTDGKESTEVIKEQNDLIRRVAENWGDAVPSLKAYVDELDRAAEASDLNKATDTLVDKAFEDARRRVADMRVELAAARVDIQAVGGTAQEIDALQAAFVALEQVTADGSATTEDLDTVMRLLAGTTGADTVPSLLGFKDVLTALIPILAAAAAEANTLRAERDALMMQGPDPAAFYDQQEFLAEQERLLGLTSEQLTLEREIERVRGEAKSSDVVLSEQQVLDLAERRVAREKELADLKAEGRAGSRAAEDALRERDAVAELIAALEHEQAMIGMSNVEKEVANALRQAGAAATEEERLRIEELVVAIDEQERAQKALTEGWEEYGKIGQASVRGIVDILKDGKVEANEWTNLLGRIGSMFLDLGVNGLFSAFKGGLGGGGGFLGGLFGFSEGGGGVVGGSGTYTPGAADDTLFIAKAQKGEPFAFGDAAVHGLAPASQGSGGLTIGSVTIHANSEMEGRAAARGFAEGMREWTKGGAGARFVRNVMANPGRANPT